MPSINPDHPGQDPPAPPPEASALTGRLLATVPVPGPWIAATLRPAVRYVATRTSDLSLGPGVTKYGGAPDLPPGTAWPTWVNRAGDVRPLRFYAQVDLDEARQAAPAPLDLPERGLLSFFVDLDDELEGVVGLYSWERAGSTVIHTAPGAALARTPSPTAPLPVARLSPIGRWTWRTAGIDLSDDEFDLLDELDDEYEKQIRQVKTARYLYGGRHQLGGFADHIQHPVEEEVVQALAGCYEGSGHFDHEAWERSRHQVAEWCLLLQIDSDEEIDAMWGDAGTIYWMARSEDVRAGRWDNGMFNFQCS